MTPNESLALAMSFIICICLVLQGAILKVDLCNSGSEDPPGTLTRVITFFILCIMWLVFTINFIPWSAAADVAPIATDVAPIATTEK